MTLLGIERENPGLGKKLGLSSKVRSGIEENRKEVLSKLTVGEAIDLGEREKLLNRVEELIGIIDDRIKKGEQIANTFEYGEFCTIYNNLEEDEIKFLEGLIISKNGNIYDEFRKVYLREKIFSILRLTLNERYRISQLQVYLHEFKNLELNFNENYLLNKCKTEREKQTILKYL